MCLLLILCLWLWPFAGSVRAADTPPSPRELLRKVMEPVVDIFARHPDSPDRALTLHWRVTEATAQLPEFRGTRMTFICQAPDRFLFQFLALDTLCTVCRQDQTIWVSPADHLAPLLKQVEEKPPTRADREPLAPMRLTIPTRLFWVLFYLISVQDEGTGTIGSQSCRRIGFRPPESGKGESLRLWINTADAANPKPARVELLGSDSHATLDIEDETFSVSVPPASFEPDAAQRASLLNVPVERFRPFMTLLGKEEEKRRKQFIHDHPNGTGGTGGT